MCLFRIPDANLLIFLMGCEMAELSLKTQNKLIISSFESK